MHIGLVVKIPKMDFLVLQCFGTMSQTKLLFHTWAGGIKGCSIVSQKNNASLATKM